MEPQFIVWFYRLLFLCLCFLTLVINLVPNGFTNTYLTFPDILYCLAASWIFRKPNYVPAPLVVGVFLFQDILFGLPIGLGTAIMLAIIEYLRSRNELIRYQSFFIEWGMVSFGYLIFILLYQLVLIITFSQPSSFGTLIFLFLETIIIYPAIVFVSSNLFKVRKDQYLLVGDNF